MQTKTLTLPLSDFPNYTQVEFTINEVQKVVHLKDLSPSQSTPINQSISDIQIYFELKNIIVNKEDWSWYLYLSDGKVVQFIDNAFHLLNSNHNHLFHYFL